MKWLDKKIDAVMTDWRDNKISMVVAVQRLAACGVRDPWGVLAESNRRMLSLGEVEHMRRELRSGGPAE